MLLIGTDDGIYRWAEGNNWPVFHGLQGHAVVGLASPGAGFLAALDSAGLVWESGNNGQSWREVPRPDGLGTPSAIAVGGTPASILLAGSGPGMFRRMLGSTLRAGSPIDLVRQAAPRIAGRAVAMVRQRTGGATAVAPPPKRTATGDLRGWTRLGVPGLATARAVPTMTATAEAWYAAVAGQGVWSTADGGMSWSPAQGLPADVHDVTAVPGKAGSLLAATSNGVWSTADGGKTWESRSIGLEATPEVRAVASCPDQPDFLLAGAAPAKSSGGPAPVFNLFESKDAGKSWVRVLRSFPENPRGDAIADIHFDPVEPDHAAVAFASGEIWVTLNGGDYWQPFARDIRAARVLCPIL